MQFKYYISFPYCVRVTFFLFYFISFFFVLLFFVYFCATGLCHKILFRILNTFLRKLNWGVTRTTKKKLQMFCSTHMMMTIYEGTLCVNIIFKLGCKSIQEGLLLHKAHYIVYMKLQKLILTYNTYSYFQYTTAIWSCFPYKPLIHVYSALYKMSI